MSKMISTTVYVTPRQKVLLEELSKVTRVPFSEFVRRGIDMAIEVENEFIANGTTLVVEP